MLDIPGYTITEKLNESQRSIVYRGNLSEEGRPVIIKVLRAEYPDSRDIARIRHEYEIARELDFEGIVQAFELKKYKNSLVLVFEDFGGISLRQIISLDKEYFRNNIPKFLELALKISQVLGEIHNKKIIHKDIKPHNIIVNERTRDVKLTDFGISTLLEREDQKVGNPYILEGTLAYMSPEQTGRMNRAVDYRSDYYSLGISLYEMLTGRRPFETEDAMEMVHSHIAVEPISPHEGDNRIPQLISQIVMKLLSKTAEDRYQSAYGLISDLQRCVDHLNAGGSLDAPELLEEFTPGKNDVSDKLQIHQKLYGRNEERSELLKAFDRSSLGIREIVLVTGPSGIGKSSLVNELHKPIVYRRGYFASGKFDQYRRNIPFTSLIQAFQELVRQVLTESDESIPYWREKLKMALGVNGRVLTDVIPEVELIIGEQPKVPELPSAESQNRFNLVFQSFIKVFAKKEHPLAIFLDDLQWADYASLGLIKTLVTASDIESLFLICAYRSNEVSSTHPLTLTIDEIRQEGATINSINLGPLTIEQTNELICDTLNYSPEQAKQLAELVYNKTQGNPFFVNHFLQTLHKAGLLKLNQQDGVWEWDFQKVEAQEITDNVVELMAAKIQKLPENTRKVLELAACMGNRFDLKTLSIVNDTSLKKTGEFLQEALLEGLIVPLDHFYKYELEDSEFQETHIPHYKFLHDQVQQATYSLIQEENKKQIHLRIGRLLLNQCRQGTGAERQLDEKIFDIVEQLNVGIELIEDADERLDLIELNLKAGMKAKVSTAYLSAIKHFTVGIEIFPGDHWETNYEIAYKLYIERAECEYLVGNFDIAEKLFDIILENAHSRFEKARIFSMRQVLYVSTGKFDESCRVGIEGLKLFDLIIPDVTDAALLKNSADQEFDDYQKNLGNREISQLMELSEMFDPEQKACMQLLMYLQAYAYNRNLLLFKLIITKMINLSILYGNTDASAFAYVYFGVIFATEYKDYIKAHELGQLALQLNQKSRETSLSCRIKHGFAATINHWRKPIKSNIPILKEAFRIGMESGDKVFSAFSFATMIRDMLLSGESTNVVLQECERTIDYMRKIKFREVFYLQLFLKNVILKLQGDLPGGGPDLDSSQFQEEEALNVWQNAGFTALIGIYHVFKLWTLYLFGEFERALEIAEKSKETIVFNSGLSHVPEHFFYTTLTIAACFPTLPDDKRAYYISEMKKNIAKMKIWADSCPENFDNKFYLMSAEMYRVMGREREAMDFYDLAIDSAHKNSFTNNEALSNELAGNFYLNLNKEKIARPYMRDARYLYLSWGASGKARQLEEFYPYPLSRESGRKDAPEAALNTEQTTFTESGSEILDLDAIVKASQALSGEINLPELLRKMMKIVIENAGAECGFVILEENGKLLIEAEGQLNQADVKIMQKTPVEKAENVSVGMINYVARTGKDVILDDVSREHIFKNDPYILSKQPRSVLCIPIMKQRNLVGVLYLENNLISGAFAPSRLKVLKVLCSQVAISIENARLFASLEDKVTERTQELNVALEELTDKDRIIQQELAIASDIQRGILPEGVNDWRELTVYSTYEPMEMIGGDFFDIMEKDDDLAVYVADVSGHGIPAALITAMAKISFMKAAQSNLHSPRQMFEKVNEDLFNLIKTNEYLTCFFLAMTGDYRVHYCNAGHSPAMLIRYNTGTLHTLYAEGFFIGTFLPPPVPYQEGSVQLEPGDRIIMITDGILEGINLEGEEYGLERFTGSILKYKHETSGEDFKNHILQEFKDFRGANPVMDDVTLIVLERGIS